MSENKGESKFAECRWFSWWAMMTEKLTVSYEVGCGDSKKAIKRQVRILWSGVREGRHTQASDKLRPAKKSLRHPIGSAVGRSVKHICG